MIKYISEPDDYYRVIPDSKNQVVATSCWFPLRTAEATRLTVPPTLLAIAAEAIE
jgi:hypothetical protein